MTQVRARDQIIDLKPDDDAREAVSGTWPGHSSFH